jgi:cytochrome P450
MSEVLSHLRDPAFYANPYALYKAVREKDPVMFTELRGGSWFFTSYADVAAGLKIPELSNARAGAFMTAMPPEARGDLQPLADTLSRWMLFYDPPRHTRIRKLMGKAFTQASIDSLRTRIERVTTELLDAVQKEGRMDVIKDLAYELPLRVIIELLGVPADKRKDFAVWSGNIGDLLGGAVPTLELARQTQRSVVEMTEYLREQVKERRKKPADDILTTLISAEEDGETLTEDELYAQCVLLLFAGHETTRNLIGNGLYALLRSPDELARLRSDPSLVKGAVEELLRYDTPVQMVSRVVTQDFEYAGRSIKKGQFGMMFMGAANRDPLVFPDPDRLDVTRKDVKHLSFAYGPHICIGAQLARLEGQIAFSALLERMPDLKLAEGAQPEFVMNLVLRGLKSLPVTF